MKRIAMIFAVLTCSLILMLSSGSFQLSIFNSWVIDSTSHGWEVKKNKDHRPPDIPQNAKDAIEKYNAIYMGDPEKKSIYLTIDLGYESGNTSAMLDVLKKNNVKATFFIVQSYLEKNPAIVDRIVNEGHSLQSHTARYKHLNKLSDSDLEREITDIHAAVKERYNMDMKYVRPPYEEWSERVLKIINDLGYKAVFWSIACVDWVKDVDAETIYKNVMSNYHNGGIILMHAVSRDSPRALDLVIKGLKEKGYELETL